MIKIESKIADNQEMNQEIIDKIGNLEVELRGLKKHVGIEVNKPRGKPPVLIQKLHTIMAKRIGYKKGIGIDSLAVSLYGISTFETRTRARQLLSFLRKRYDLPIYSVKPYGVKGKRNERYCILSDIIECKQVNEHLEKVKDGVKKSQRRVLKRENDIVNMKKIRQKQVVKNE